MKVGIDPGLEGAIALLQDNEVLADLIDMPVMPMGKHKHQINAAALAKLLKNWKDIDCRLTACVEYVSAAPGQGVSAMFNFGVSYGVVQGVLGALQIPVTFVTPAVWKKRAGLPQREKGQKESVYKDIARTRAQQLYPVADLSRKKDVGRADALLIARFGEKGE